MSTSRLSAPFTIITDLPENGGVITWLLPGKDTETNPTPYETCGQLKGRLLFQHYAGSVEEAERQHVEVVKEIAHIVNCIQSDGGALSLALANWIEKGWVVVGAGGQPTLSDEAHRMACLLLTLPAGVRNGIDQQASAVAVGVWDEARVIT